MTDAIGPLLTAGDICKDTGRARRTLGNWIKTVPGFPKPRRINGGLYFRQDEYENFKKKIFGERK